MISIHKTGRMHAYEAEIRREERGNNSKQPRSTSLGIVRSPRQHILEARKLIFGKGLGVCSPGVGMTRLEGGRDPSDSSRDRDGVRSVEGEFGKLTKGSFERVSKQRSVRTQG
jgi:hypothetical protein